MGVPFNPKRSPAIMLCGQPEGMADWMRYTARYLPARQTPFLVVPSGFQQMTGAKAPAMSQCPTG